MKLRAKDLPVNGPPVRAVCLGVEFEVCRRQSYGVRSQFTYSARRLPAVEGGWWHRWNWELMKADIQLMAKEVNDEQSTQGA